MKAENTFRVTRISADKKRSVSKMTQKQLQVFRAKRLKEMRKNELGLTQKEFADAIGINLRTLQDWERGRTHMSKPAEILMTLMKTMPSVRKKLLKENLATQFAA